MMTPMSWRFGDYELDEARMAVSGPEGPVHVEPQVFAVLRHLLLHRDRVVTKNELLDEVWGDRFVSEAALSSRVMAARQAVGDDGKRQAVIRTVHGVGFQFVAEVARLSTAREESTRAESRLPAPAGPLVGRERELAAVVKMLESERLVTLTGPGGVGKTRLALAAAAAAEGSFGDGSYFVPLADISDVEEVGRFIAETIGAYTAGEATPLESMRERLRGAQSLLVLDNFEHVIEAAPIVTGLIESLPGLRVLVTSRERLRLAGEWVFAVDPLPVGAGHDEAVTLFERAGAAASPGFAVDEGNRADIEAICGAVDGLPLAIELAAGQLAVLSPPRLRERLAERADALGPGRRDQAARHATIRETIEWSVRLLSEQAKELLTTLAVFEAPATVDAIEAVAGDGETLAALTELVDKSLVRRLGGEEPRFGMLELIREYARDLLRESGREAAVRNAHARACAAFVQEVDAGRWDRGASTWVDAILSRFADISAALEWSFEHGEAVVGARIAAGMYAFWHREGRHTEGQRWNDAADPLAGELSALERGQLHVSRAYTLFYLHEMAAAREAWEAAIEEFAGSGHDRHRALALVNLAGSGIGVADDYSWAVETGERGIELARKFGEPALLAHGLNVLGEVHRNAGADEAARAVYEEALLHARDAGDRRLESIVLANLAYLAEHRGEAEEALRIGKAALRICWDLGSRVLAAWSVGEMAGPYAATGEWERAARLVGAAETSLRLLGGVRGPGDVAEFERVQQALVEALGEGEVLRLEAEGSRLRLEEAVAYALGESDPWRARTEEEPTGLRTG